MSQNYCQSSSLLKIPADKLDQAKEIAARVNEEIQNDEDYVGCCVEILRDESGVWIYDEENFDPNHACEFAQKIIEGLGINEPFVFSWSYSSSKMRFDEFGGGACIIKRGFEPYFIDARQQAEEHLKNGGMIPLDK